MLWELWNLIHKKGDFVPKIELRYPRVSDAKKYYDMINNPNFKFFYSCPPSIEEEINWIKNLPKKRNKKLEYNYSIIYNNNLVGGCGIKIDQHSTFIGEIGYFVDEKFWGKSIAPKAVKLLIKKGREQFSIRRFQLITDPANKASCRVAEKCGFTREGLLKKVIKTKKGFADGYLYAKVK